MENETLNFGKGGVKDVPDIRDHLYEDVARSSLPFDWGVGFDIETIIGKLPTKNQGQSFSCGGQAWSYYMTVLEALSTKTLEERSASYIYSQTFVPGGGSTGRDNCDICIKQGDPIEKLCLSYQNGNPPSELYMQTVIRTELAKNDAKLSQAYSYANVAANINLIAQAVRDNGGMVIGVYGKDNGTWLSAYPKPPEGAQGAWAHWLYVGKAKIINGKKYIGVKNSWGNIGEEGWQWLGEDYIDYIWSGWTMIFKPVVNNQYIFTRDMKYGDTSEDVRQLQIRLGVPIPTGYYGSVTRGLVLNYQIQHVTLSWWERWFYRGYYCGAKTRASLNG